MPLHLPRRRFLQTSAALAAGAVLTDSTAAAQPKPPPAKERLRLGIIGCTGQGAYNLSNVRQENIVALCDVDATRAAPVFKDYPKARVYEDYRRLIEQKDVQAVVISTPDHHHAFAAVAAMRAGKHVYCEKPLAHSVFEVRRMMEVAAQNKVVTQMGTQIHAEDNYRRVVEIVRAGVLGPVRRVHVWNSSRPEGMFRVKQAQPIPRGLNYDLWLGPAPEQHYPPFRANRHNSVHFDWRWWWDFGGGILADLACHYMDLPHWALNLRQPATIEATGRVTHKGDNDMPDIMRVDYRYPARGNLPPVHLTWYHGVSGPDLEGKTTYQGFTSAVLFEGEKGSVVANYGAHRLLPEDRFKGFERPKQTIPRSIGHHREWLEAIRTGGQTTCNFDYSGALSETVLLGNVAYKAGVRIQYDAKTGRIAGNEKAERFLRRETRKGWTL